MKILLTGSSGLVGTALTQMLLREGHTVVRLMRSGTAKKANGQKAQTTGDKEKPGRLADVAWNPTTCDLEGEPFGEGRERHEVEGADAVVNLAGASIAEESWNEERKALLRASRIHITRELVCALQKLSAPPKTLVSASAIGYYGNRGDELLTEESKPGDDFLGRLAQEWEAEAVKAEAMGLRVVRLRFGVILAKHGGALPQMLRPYRFGAGGRMGSGQQWVSWVTLDDAVRVIYWVLNQSEVGGALNVVAPEAVQNAEFARELGRAVHRPAILPAPAFALKFALGEMADALLLASQRVDPARLRQLGFSFEHPELATALASVLIESPAQRTAEAQT